jgi:hypothetical protein
MGKEKLEPGVRSIGSRMYEQRKIVSIERNNRNTV